MAMLTSIKKPALTQVQPTHVDLFVEHYDQLKGWALQFTERDHELAEDLLHDAFIQFTISKPDLDSIDKIDGYLFILMRNLHLSHLRKVSRTPLKPVAVVDFDTVDMSFWASDPRDRIRLRDELAAVCQYACIRKESAKVGSVLILRFFHGYYPEEIGKVLRTNALAATKRLMTARAEAKLYLEDPDRFSLIGTKQFPKEKPAINHFGDDLRLELRRLIFASRQGSCFPDAELNDLYTAEAEKGIDQKTVAHIVSCQPCLDSVNTMLDLPLLSSRYPLDTIGNDPGKKGGDGGGTGSGAVGPRMLDSFINRRDAHFNHQPQELCVAVNGQLQTSQEVVSGKGNFTLVVDIDESLGFVEVFSEIGLRLLMLNVEPPPNGDGKQTAHVNLSGGRTIDANLSFGGARPTLHVSYNDPLLSEEFAAEITTAPNVFSVLPAVADGEKCSPPSKGGGDAVSADGVVVSADGRGGSLFPTLETEQGSWRDWFSPMRVAFASTILIAILAGIWFLSLPTTETLVARTVLSKAREAEFAMAPTAERVLHRNYQVEEWTNGSLKSRQRIDEWQQPKIAARRTYDESGQMVAGVWTKEDGSLQVFEQGERLRDVYARDAKSVPSAVAGGALYAEPTANAFANLIDRHGVTSRVAISETPTLFVFNFEDRAGETEQKGISERLLVASIAIDRTTYNPVSQTLVLQVGNEVREYRFSDVRVEQKPLAEVSPLIFQPEAELAKGATTVTKPVLSEPGAVATGSERVITPATATLDTEVEVFRALDSVNALSGDQINVTRTASGQLKISGIVDSAQRKSEILNALNSVKNSPGVTIDILTGAEAVQRQKQTIAGDNITIESVTAEVNTQLPVEPELKAYLSKRGITGESLETEIKEYASAVLNRSRALRRNALALKSLAERFSNTELEKLDATKRDQWKALLRSKAAAVAGDVRSLSSQLSAVGLNAGGGDPSGGANINDASDLSSAAQRLFGLAAACDAQVQQSFSISGRGGAAQVKAVQFWRNLSQMSSIATDVQKF